MDKVEIASVTAVNDEVVAAMARLVPQLSPSALPPTAAELEAIVSSPSTTLLIARDLLGEGRAIGALTLAVFRIPTGIRAWIEDVVVDEAARGRGVGDALCREALRLAEAAGARTVELTSRPSRDAANRLYQRLGFARRETNVYRYSFEGSVDARPRGNEPRSS
jgi:ribosomal protein S18 acetylase RimI-like enzyme